MPGLAPYKRILTANQRSNINVRGTTVFLRAATGEISVTVRSQQVGSLDGVAYTLRMNAAEKWFHAQEFDQIEIVNETALPNTIELYIGYGDFEKPVPDIINVQVTSLASASVETTPDVANAGIGNANKVTILAANPNRISAILTALSTNTAVARIGGADVDTNEGTPLQAGDTILWTSKAACEACVEAAGNGTLAVLEHIG